MNSGKLPFLASGAFCLFLFAGCSNESEHSSSSPALTAEPARSPIIRQNTNCGGCDPSCYGMSDTPTGADLNEDNSENLRYDLDRDGLVATGAVGTYTRRYDARFSCEDSFLQPSWDMLFHEVETPTGTRVEFHARTAETVSALEGAPRILVGTVADSTDNFQLWRAFADAGVSEDMRYLIIEAELHASPDGVTSPVLHSFSTVLYCVCECDTDAVCQADCPCDRDCRSS